MIYYRLISFYTILKSDLTPNEQLLFDVTKYFYFVFFNIFKNDYVQFVFLKRKANKFNLMNVK